MKPRNTFGFKSVSAIVPKIVKPFVSKKTALISKLASEWHLITDNEVASKTRPVKVIGIGNQKTGKITNSNIVLILEVEEGYATEIAMMEPMILSSISTYFGYQMINKLKFRQVSSLSKNSLEPYISLTKTISDAEAIKIHNMVAEIDDPELNKALTSLMTTYKKREQ